jgi:hypothetical protein
MNNQYNKINAQKKGFIAKKEKGSGPFEDLYLEGVQLLQNLSGEKWTDYNLHDPGITILENLAYALTSVSHIAEQPIQDLLVQGKGSQLESGDNGFFIPSEILTTNPITINDFRKVMIDQVVNLKNAWFESMNDMYALNNKTATINNVRGLYCIFIELHRYSEDPKSATNENARIKQEVKKLFHAHRNLCEDLYEVTILKPLKLQIVLELTVNDLINGDDILAEIFYKIRNYISLDPKFRSLWELQNEEIAVNTIFNGPLLENGFIEDNQLKDRSRELLFSDMVSIINKFENVVSVDKFNLLIDNELYDDPTLKQVKKGKLIIPLNYAPVLELPKDKKQLAYKNAGITFTSDLEEVKKKLSYIEAKNYGSFKSVSKSFNRIDIPESREPQSLTYYPLRKQFPPTYGIGDYGLSAFAPEKRRAQAKQLKAYLLPFDQLMANFIAQLTNIYTLYEVKQDEMQSYFYRELKDMPELTALIRENNFTSDEAALDDWKKTLAALHQTFDTNATVRLNKVADSLLARFGETFPDYALRKMHRSVYKINERDEQLERHLLLLKRNLIKDYAQLSYNRAKAYDYKQPVKIMGDFYAGRKKHKLIPGLVQKIALLLGISNIGIRSFTKIIEDADIKIYKRSKDVEEWENEKLEIIYTDKGEEVLEYDDVVIIDEEVTDLHGSFYFYGNQETILKDVLKNGIHAGNYEIKSSKNNPRHPSYYILFKYGKHRARVSHISHSYKQASKELGNLITRLKKVNEDSEGFYMIEHLLLAPPYKSKSFGFEFSVNPTQDLCISFCHHELANLDDRNKNAVLLMNEFKGNGKLQFRSINNQGTYEIQILSNTGEQIASSKEKFVEKEMAETIIRKIVTYLKTDSYLESDIKIEFYAHYGNQKVNEDFFSHKMSFVFPSWPARFQDPNFKTRLRNVVLEEYPAHIAFDTIWLHFDTMKKFEENYFKWLQVVSNNIYKESQMAYAHALIQIIQKYFLKNHHKALHD